jgi:PPP family 3-phenylpropionic acid transporter
VLALRGLFLSSGAALGVVFPFIALILFARGYDVVGVGLIAGISALAGVLALPAWGHVADVVTGRRRAVQLSALVASGALVLTLAPVTGLVLSALFVLFWIAATTIGPVVDALAVNAVADPRRDYARVRLLGSLGFALVAIGVGFVYAEVGYTSAVGLYVAAAAVIVVAAIGVPDVRRADLDEAGPETALTRPRFGSIGLAFRMAPRLPAVLLAIGLIHITIIGSFTFLTVYLDELGGGPTSVALATGLAALIEVPAFLVAGRLARRTSLAVLFVAGALTYSLTVLSWTVIDEPALIVASRAVTGIGYAFLYTAAVVTIAQLLPKRLQATGQTLFSMVGFGIAALIADVSGGFLWDVGGATLVFGLAGAAGLAAAVVGWRALPGQLSRSDGSAAPGA